MCRVLTRPQNLTCLWNSHRRYICCIYAHIYLHIYICNTTCSDAALKDQELTEITEPWTRPGTWTLIHNKIIKCSRMRVCLITGFTPTLEPHQWNKCTSSRAAVIWLSKSQVLKTFDKILLKKKKSPASKAAAQHVLCLQQWSVEADSGKTMAFKDAD